MKINRTCKCMVVLMGGLFFFHLPAAAASAEKQLQSGIEAYQKNDTDKALDYFIDVLMNGNSEQVAQANKYIDAIHNKIGGIKQPVEVDVSFPDQPVQTILNKTEEWENQANQSAQNAVDALNTMPQTLTEQIEQRQLANYTQQGMQPVTDTQAAVLDNAAVLATQADNGAATAQTDLNAIASQYNQQVQQAGAVTPQVTEDMNRLANDYQLQDAASNQIGTPSVQPTQNATYFTPNLSPAVHAEHTFSSSAEPVGEPGASAQNDTSNSSQFTDLTSPAAVDARNLYVAQKLQSMRDATIAKLSNQKGIHLYLRPDGRPDAIDVDEGVLFHANAFRPEAFGTLNDIFELLALTQGTRYIILPAGSYTDDVTLSGIRQAMALKSYLTKRGISQGKLQYNMGLVDEEVPTQFSNLKGLSVVFDYDADFPTRMLENADQETAPLLSMAIVPQCHAIDRSLGEAYAIDFSVLDTVNSIDHWTLQVVEHGRNGTYYIVRQLEGFSPVYHQILWNGRKGIIGPELPCGKYTLVLTAVDTMGKKNVLRRRVVVKCAGAAVMGSCETGTCTKKKVSDGTQAVLNYKSSRLWKKPNRRMCVSKTCVAAEAEAPQASTPEAKVEEKEETQTQSSATATYTKTQTVRNVVVDDTSAQTGVLSSSEDTGYAPLPADAGGYAAADEGQYSSSSYEEEYTTY